jgi:ATP-dependent DNA ligase
VPPNNGVAAATGGERGVHLVYYAFDLLYIGGQDVSSLPLLKRKTLLEPWSQISPDFSSMDMRRATANSS